MRPATSAILEVRNFLLFADYLSFASIRLTSPLSMASSTQPGFKREVNT